VGADAVLAAAARAGFPVVNGERIDVDPAAVRMLPSQAAGLAVSLSGGVLEVLVDHVPVPSLISRFEELSGCRVAVAVVAPDVLERVRARALDAAASDMSRSLRTALSAAAALNAWGLQAVVGSVPAAVTASGLAGLAGWPVLSAQDMSVWVHELTGSDRLGSDVTLVLGFGADRWRVQLRVSGGAVSVSARRVPAQARRLDQLGVPALGCRLADEDSGLVLVAGGPCSGRSSTALALAERAAGRRPVLVEVIGDAPESAPAGRAGQVVVRRVGTDVVSVAAGVQSAVAAGVSVLVVDAVLSEADMRAVVSAAEAGLLVVCVVPAASSVAALSLSADLLGGVDAFARLAGCLAGVLVCSLSSGLDLSVVALFEVVVGTAGVRRALASGGPAQVVSAVQAAGRSAGVLMDTALSTARSAGRIA